jgi:hypothetical protein
MTVPVEENQRKHILKSVKIGLKTLLMVYSAKSTLAFILARKITGRLAFNGPDTRLGLSIAGLRSSYFYLRPALSRIYPKHGAAISAAISSLWLIVDRNEYRRFAIGLSLLVKAAWFAIRAKIYGPKTKVGLLIPTKIKTWTWN